MIGGGGAQRLGQIAPADADGIQPLVEAFLAQGIIGVAEIDLPGSQVARMNPLLAGLLGCDAADPLARQLVLLIGPPLSPSMPPRPAQLKRRDGSFIPVLLTRLRLGPGRALLLVARDKGSVEAEQAAERFRDIYENVSEGIYRSSIDGQQLSANPALVRLNGYASEAEMLAGVKNIAAEWYVDPRRRDLFCKLVLEHGRVENFVSEVYRHKTRERIWISENARLVRDRATGVALYFEGTVREITETVRRLQLEERLRTIVETIADGVVATDSAGVIQSANRAACRMFGWPGKELIGRPLSDLIADANGNALTTLSALGGQQAQGRRQDGTLFPLDIALGAAAGQAGTMMICCMRDATNRVRYLEGLRQAKEAAERANRAKSDFLAMMSHELRTPLNAVIGMTGLLLEGALDDPARRHAATLREAADHLLALINDVLDFSKLEAGRLELEEIEFEPESVLHGALDLLAPRAHAKGLELCGYVGADVPAHALGDPGRLRQVLINLVGNAVKFTERGAVTVELERLPADDGEVALACEVRDSGIGIRPEQLPLLFKEFAQADSSVSRRFGGTGLGLAICNKLVTGMGGQLTAKSMPGEGSTFRFTVHLRAAAPVPAPPPVPPTRLDGMAVLVVDDNAINRGMFARQLQQRGADVTLIEDARTALRALRGGARFSAALIDHAMPEIDGESLARAIRAEPAANGVRLVLATSSLTRAETRTAAGTLFDAVLTKPVPTETLARALSPTPYLPAAPAAPPVPAQGLRPVRVLVAEDNAANQLVIRTMIERMGHRADLVANGVEALEAVRSRPYDLVLMDVMMPEMDGIDATRRIRALPPPLCALPVLGLTAHVAPEDHAEFHAAGMDSVITKPVSAKALAEAIAPVATRLARTPG
jgi:two-component system sensor histidine kinase/response regulator